MKRILAYALLLLLLAAGSYSATATCYTCVQYMNQSPLCHDYVIPEQGFGLTYCYQMEYGCSWNEGGGPNPPCMFGDCDPPRKCGPDQQG